MTYADKTVEELRKLAKRMGVVRYSTKNRAQLLAALSKVSKSSRKPSRKSRKPKKASRSRSPRRCRYGVKKSGGCKKKPGRRSRSRKSSKKSSKKSSRSKGKLRLTSKQLGSRRRYHSRRGKCSGLKEDICEMSPDCNWSPKTNRCVRKCSGLKEDICEMSPYCNWSPKTNRCVRKSRGLYPGPLPKM